MAALPLGAGSASLMRQVAVRTNCHPSNRKPTAHARPNRELTLEQRADIFMARKNYADAADYYYRALKQSSFKDPVLWNKLGIAFQQENKFHSARKAYNKRYSRRQQFRRGAGTTWAPYTSWRRSMENR